MNMIWLLECPCPQSLPMFVCDRAWCGSVGLPVGLRGSLGTWSVCSWVWASSMIHIPRCWLKVCTTFASNNENIVMAVFRYVGVEMMDSEAIVMVALFSTSWYLPLRLRGDEVTTK